MHSVDAWKTEAADSIRHASDVILHLYFFSESRLIWRCCSDKFVI